MQRPLLLVAFLVAIPGTPAAAADPAPAASYAEMQQAYGRLLGDLFFVGDVSGKCAGQHPALKTDADAAFTGWTERNLVVTTAREALVERARQEGGEDEVGRLSRLIERAGQRVAGATGRFATLSRSQCMAAIDSIRSGEHDVARKHPREIALLLAGRDAASRNGS